jgi:hypothetical protein
MAGTAARDPSHALMHALLLDLTSSFEKIK